MFSNSISVIEDAILSAVNLEPLVVAARGGFSWGESVETNPGIGLELVLGLGL